MTLKWITDDWWAIQGLQTLARFRSDRITGLSFHGSYQCHVKKWGFSGEKNRNQMLCEYQKIIGTNHIWHMNWMAEIKKGFFIFGVFSVFIQSLDFLVWYRLAWEHPIVIAHELKWKMSMVTWYLTYKILYPNGQITHQITNSIKLQLGTANIMWNDRDYL